MVETKWTPGPWSLGPSAVVIGDDGRRVCQLVVRVDATDVADAHLIAAAPDLAEVARMVVEASDLSGVFGPLSDAARAALARACGEAPS